MGERRRTVLTMLAGASAAAGLAWSAADAAQTASKAPATKAAQKAATSRAVLRADQVDLLINTLKNAPAEGFAETDFPTDGLDAARTGDAAAQQKLTTEIVAYAKAQHGLRLSHDDFDKYWGIKPAAYDAAKDFNFAVAQDKLPAWIADLPPPFQRYRQLRDGLRVYGNLARGNAWKPVPAGSDMTVGATGERVKALRARLVFEDPPLGATPADAPFDEALADSVKRFQARHGLNPTGLVSTATIAALNIAPDQRARQIRANLERWRWLPRNLAPSRVEVNVPAAQLQVYEGDKPTLQMLSVAGKPEPEDDHTPMLVGKITSIVLNPAWHVPASIAPELYKKQKANKGYFASEGISAQPGNKIAPLIQKPGPKNSLGQIKFDFENPFGVYLHDTPGQAAFTHSARDVSHGCVRLEKPVDLAALLLTPNGDWPRDKIEQAVKGEDTQRVALKQGEPVYLLYFTAYGEGAQISFRADPYGWDAKLLRLLDAGRPGQG